MPPKGIEPGGPQDWLRHAWSDLELARIKRNSKVLLEDLCFHAEQAAEKALKAVLVFESVAFPEAISDSRDFCHRLAQKFDHLYPVQIGDGLSPIRKSRPALQSSRLRSRPSGLRWFFQKGTFLKRRV